MRQQGSRRSSAEQQRALAEEFAADDEMYNKLVAEMSEKDKALFAKLLSHKDMGGDPGAGGSDVTMVTAIYEDTVTNTHAECPICFRTSQGQIQ